MLDVPRQEADWYPQFSIYWTLPLCDAPELRFSLFLGHVSIHGIWETQHAV